MNHKADHLATSNQKQQVPPFTSQHALIPPPNYKIRVLPHQSTIIANYQKQMTVLVKNGLSLPLPTMRHHKGQILVPSTGPLISAPEKQHNVHGYTVDQ